MNENNLHETEKGILQKEFLGKPLTPIVKMLKKLSLLEKALKGVPSPSHEGVTEYCIDHIHDAFRDFQSCFHDFIEAEDGKVHIKMKATLKEKGIKIYKDGNKWCAVFEDFIDLQESIAGFGETPALALSALMKERDAEQETL